MPGVQWSTSNTTERAPVVVAWQAVLVLLLIALLFALVPQRVGDGSEYYALYLAWAKTLRPWMNPESLVEYGRLVASGQVPGLVPDQILANTFPSLRIRDTFDFNHFWLYSLLAAAVGKLAALMGVTLSVQAAFLILHLLLLVLPAWLALYRFGPRGALIVVGMTVGSPMVWFLDKVHTELFTYSLVLSAVILLMGRAMTWAALVLAIASTQNPPLAIVAGFVLALRVLWFGRQPFSVFEMMAAAATAVTVLMHPAYYFARYGVLTPQLLEAGASLGENLRYFYIWIIDPDVGLLPNWPAGLLVITAAVTLMIARRIPRESLPNLLVLLFAAVYLAVCLYGHSSTTNINSGATRGVSRYAIWYMPLVFPLALGLADAALRWERARWRYALAVIILALALVTIIDYNPRRGEAHTTPSLPSRVVQTYVPWLYDPPPEVFVERFTGFGDGGLPPAVKAVVGPDCRKVLLAPGAERTVVAAPAQCGYDTVALGEAVDSMRAATTRVGYSRIPDSMLVAIRLRLDGERFFDTKAGGDGVRMLGVGWSVPEAWGVWSDGPTAELRIVCPEGQGDWTVALHLHAFTSPAKPSNAVTAIIGTRAVWNGTIGSDAMEVPITVPRSSCSRNIARIRVDIADVRSPKDLGLSGDVRQIGVGITGITYLATPRR